MSTPTSLLHILWDFPKLGRVELVALAAAANTDPDAPKHGLLTLFNIFSQPVRVDTAVDGSFSIRLGSEEEMDIYANGTLSFNRKAGLSIVANPAFDIRYKPKTPKVPAFRLAGTAVLTVKVEGTLEAILQGAGTFRASIRAGTHIFGQPYLTSDVALFNPMVSRKELDRQVKDLFQRESARVETHFRKGGKIASEDKFAWYRHHVSQDPKQARRFFENIGADRKSIAHGLYTIFDLSLSEAVNLLTLSDGEKIKLFVGDFGIKDYQAVWDFLTVTLGYGELEALPKLSGAGFKELATEIHNLCNV